MVRVPLVGGETPKGVDSKRGGLQRGKTPKGDFKVGGLQGGRIQRERTQEEKDSKVGVHQREVQGRPWVWGVQWGTTGGRGVQTQSGRK